MATESDDPTDREVPEDETRKQILVHTKVRGYLRRRSDETGQTYSQQLADWLPDDLDAALVHEVPDEDIVHIKATPAVHEQVMELTGKRVKPGDVIAYYGLLDAVEQGNFDRANRLATVIPDRLWDVLAVLDEDNVLTTPDQT